jgi:hypothetical protein
MTTEREDDREPEASPEELREAEALARVLDGQAGPADTLPADALEAAALLQASAGPGGGELSDVRRRAVRKRVLAGAPSRHPAARTAATAAALVGLAAALVLALSARRPLATALPAPSAALLAAQAEAARPHAPADPLLAREMGAYRRQVLAAMAARYAKEEKR